ncbi:MAG: F0F1 ATP synthase subunit gamma [Taibaiella sp.]|nr:F0F1 ATP synthase subunit gamma [Taibaiella sp.]
MDTLESLRRKIESAGDLGSVVKAMKATAAANIGQYQMAEAALTDYFHTIELGLTCYFSQEKKHFAIEVEPNQKNKSIGVLVFGSDQGLVGQFNDVLSRFVADSLNEIEGKKIVWAVGERARDSLTDSGFVISKLLSVPAAIKSVPALVGQIIVDIEASRNDKAGINAFYIFHNSPKKNGGYEPVLIQLLPMDQNWKQDLKKQKWPTNELPEVVGDRQATLRALIREYLFVSIYKVCAESLASENESRLEAMQRAEKNINDLSDELNRSYHRIRQDSIDEELFDVISGFEALKKDKKR